MKITIARTINGGATFTMSESNYDILSRTSLKDCPFKDYNAIDLLHDLMQMYLWKLERGRSYTVNEFLTLCNDAHAEAYRNIYIQEA